jgi:hypothetical protein
MAKSESPISRAERFSLQRPIRYRQINATDWLEGKTINISRTGILFEAKDVFDPNMQLDIRVDFPLNAILTCRGTVVRSECSESRIALAVRMQKCNLRNSEKSC